MRANAAIAFGITLVSLSACDMGTGRLPVERSLSNTPWGYTLVSSPVRAGEVAQRFEVRAGDCSNGDGTWSDCANDRERSEVFVTRDIMVGENLWIALSLYLPADFVSVGNVQTALGQIHQEGGPSDANGGWPPLIQFEARGDDFSACVHLLTGSFSDVQDRCHTIRLASVAAMRGKWTDLVIHFDSAAGGQAEFYVNGTNRGSLDDFINFPPKNYFVKYGIARSFVTRNGEPMPTQVVLFDEVRIGNTMAEVAVNADQPVD